MTAGGIERPFADVFRDEDLDAYRSHFAHTVPGDADEEAELAAYRKWRTWQMSDHSPLWVEIRTDFSDAYLRPIAER